MQPQIVILEKRLAGYEPVIARADLDYPASILALKNELSSERGQVCNTVLWIYQIRCITQGERKAWRTPRARSFQRRCMKLEMHQLISPASIQRKALRRE
jgi:hypothetical protein